MRRSSSPTAAAPTRARDRRVWPMPGNGRRRRQGDRLRAMAQALVASTGVIGVNLKMDAVRSGIPARGGRALGRRRRGCGRRDHDDRPVSQVLRGRSRHTARPVSRRRHGQGLRHDRAAHGHHARVLDDGRRRRARDAPPRAPRGLPATRSTPSRSMARARPTTACLRWRAATAVCASTKSCIPALFEGLRAVALDLSLGSFAAARARPS